MPGDPKCTSCDDWTYGNFKEYICVNVIQKKKKEAEQKDKYSFVQKNVKNFIIVFHGFLVVILKIHNTQT